MVQIHSMRYKIRRQHSSSPMTGLLPVRGREDYGDGEGWSGGGGSGIDDAWIRMRGMRGVERGGRWEEFECLNFETARNE